MLLDKHPGEVWSVSVFIWMGGVWSGGCGEPSPTPVPPARRPLNLGPRSLEELLDDFHGSGLDEFGAVLRREFLGFFHEGVLGLFVELGRGGRRVATGTPTCAKNSSCPAGAHRHSRRRGLEALVKLCGALAGICRVSPARTVDFSPRKVASISPSSSVNDPRSRADAAAGRRPAGCACRSGSSGRRCPRPTAGSCRCLRPLRYEAGFCLCWAGRSYSGVEDRRPGSGWHAGR